MFDKSHPATNVHELVEYLNTIHCDHVVYRGQVKDYDALIPSFYRNKLSSTRYESATNRTITQYNSYNRFINYDSTKDTQRNIGKRLAMNYLMGHFGKSFGNVLAQQYGISSECLDVTSDPSIAAFFATHLWPTYAAPIDSSELGVIYRIEPTGDSFEQHAGTELLLSAHFLLDDPIPIPLLYSSMRHQHSDQEFADLDQQYHFELRKTMTRPVLLDATQLQHIVLTYFNAKYPEIDIQPRYEQSRIHKQKAGFFIPSFCFNSYVPRDLHVITPDSSSPLHGLQIYTPPFVIDAEKVVLEDILAYPKIERFYFRHHASCTPTYTREDLWPSKEQDYFFNLLHRWCSDGCHAYLSKLQVDVDDRDHGILDRGYYT